LERLERLGAAVLFGAAWSGLERHVCPQTRVGLRKSRKTRIFWPFFWARDSENTNACKFAIILYRFDMK
jgi:hypothetical protein